MCASRRCFVNRWETSAALWLPCQRRVCTGLQDASAFMVLYMSKIENLTQVEFGISQIHSLHTQTRSPPHLICLCLCVTRGCRGSVPLYTPSEVLHHVDDLEFALLPLDLLHNAVPQLQVQLDGTLVVFLRMQTYHVVTNTNTRQRTITITTAGGGAGSSGAVAAECRGHLLASLDEPRADALPAALRTHQQVADVGVEGLRLRDEGQQDGEGRGHDEPRLLQDHRHGHPVGHPARKGMHQQLSKTQHPMPLLNRRLPVRRAFLVLFPPACVDTPAVLVELQPPSRRWAEGGHDAALPQQRGQVGGKGGGEGQRERERPIAGQLIGGHGCAHWLLLLILGCRLAGCLSRNGPLG
mmetsp:Transcript_43269/g.108101  ORF Transcript_43269/g.108101 Transcript_43269/m.108101 type:complete len:354 (-) Transcript_43269:42-1103(-)